MKLGYVGAIALAVLPLQAAAQGTTQVLQGEPVSAAGDTLGFSFSTGALYSSGDYGEATKTDVTVVPFAVRARAGAFRLSAMLPYLRIVGPGNIVGGAEGSPIVTGPGGTARTTREGWGDLNLSAAFDLPHGALGGADLELGGRVKFPTSSSRRSLGTGETDAAISAELSYAAGNWIPFLNVGYRFLGDPAGVDIRDGVTASLGTVAQLGKVIAIVSYDFSQATTSTIDDSHSLFGALSGRLSENLILTGYAIAGLSEGSPDYGVGVLLSLEVD